MKEDNTPIIDNCKLINKYIILIYFFMCIYIQWNYAYFICYFILIPTVDIKNTINQWGIKEDEHKDDDCVIVENIEDKR